jgi:broad specificity phosphatase PhoE
MMFLERVLMKLYLIRHGQSEANFNKAHSGWGAIGLTAEGRAQAEKIRGIFQNITFDKVYSSDLLRARQTLDIALPNAEAELCPLIREINVGFLAKRPVADCIAEFGDEYIKNKKNFNYKAYDGENRDEFCARIQKFLTMLEVTPYEKVAAFCHGGVIHHVLDVIMGTTIDKSFFANDNCGITVLEYNRNGWRVVTWNYTGEL